MDAYRIVARLILASIVLTPLTALHAADVLPAEAFGALPAVNDVELSPDGKLLAWSEPDAKGPRVVVFELDAHKVKRVLGFPADLKLRSLAWADSETLLSTASAFVAYDRSAAGHYEVFRTYASDVNAGTTNMLLMADGARPLVTGATLLAWRTPKPKTVIMSTMDFSSLKAKQQTGTRLTVGRKDEGWVSFVFQVDTRTGKGTPLESGTAFTEDWVVNRNGEPVARSEWNPASRVFTINAKAGLGWKEIFRSTDEGERVIHGLTADEKSIVISAVTSSGHRTLWALPLDGSSEGSALIADDVNDDMTQIFFDRITRVPTSVSLGGAEQSLRWLDKDSERRFRSVAAAFKGKRVAVYGRSEDGKRVLAQVDGPSSPPVYYFIDFAKATADIVGEAYPALVNAKLGEVRVIEYKARDGVAVPAYLTIPPGSEGKNLPLVVLPHGGPESRDDYAFDWWAQFLAVRGYAVLQPQFRGSTGFGMAWAEAGRRQWGGLMQDDVTDGVKAMIAQGIADPARVCIVGASYGGYAALAGAAFTPDLYRCAVSVNGVSSLPAMLNYQKEHSGAESNSLAYWRDHIGGSMDKNVVEKSPVNAAAQIKVPVMLMHAANDTVVPQSQSQQMLRELEKLKKPVTYVALAGEDHWLSQSGTRLQMLKELDKFLSEHLR